MEKTDKMFLCNIVRIRCLAPNYVSWKPSKYAQRKRKRNNNKITKQQPKSNCITATKETCIVWVLNIFHQTDINMHRPRILSKPKIEQYNVNHMQCRTRIIHMVIFIKRSTQGLNVYREMFITLHFVLRNPFWPDKLQNLTIREDHSE